MWEFKGAGTTTFVSGSMHVPVLQGPGPRSSIQASMQRDMMSMFLKRVHNKLPPAVATLFRPIRHPTAAACRPPAMQRLFRPGHSVSQNLCCRRRFSATDLRVQRVDVASCDFETRSEFRVVNGRALWRSRSSLRLELLGWERLQGSLGIFSMLHRVLTMEEAYAFTKRMWIVDVDA